VILHEVRRRTGANVRLGLVAGLAPPVCCCWKGFLRHYGDVGKELDCSDIIDELYPEPGDPIVDKFGYGAFHNTNLDDLLKARHVESVLVTGT